MAIPHFTFAKNAVLILRLCVRFIVIALRTMWYVCVFVCWVNFIAMLGMVLTIEVRSCYKQRMILRLELEIHCAKPNMLM